MITPTQFNLFVTNVETAIGAVYDTDPVPTVWSQIASELPCTSSQMTMGWMELMPKFRAWYGARQPKQPAPRTYTVIMQPFECTHSIDRFQLDDDLMGIYYRQLPDMARQSRRHPDYQIRDMLEASGVQGTTQVQTGFDGLTAFNTAHPVDAYSSQFGTYCNDFVGGVSIGGVTVGGPLGVVALTTLWEYGKTILGEDGERLGVNYDTLMHPPTLSGLVNELLGAAFFSPPTWGGFQTITGQVGTSDNTLKRMGLKPLENHFLASNSKYYMLDTSKSFKPFLWIVREATRVVPMTNETDFNVFNNHTFQWGAWNRVAPTWNFPWLFARSG